MGPHGIDRRNALVCVLAAVLSRSAWAEESSRPRRIGLFVGRGVYWDKWVATRKEALAALGWGPRSVAYVARVPEFVDLDAMAAELIAERVEVIMTEATPRTLALQRATTKVPIVAYLADPVDKGLARSLRAPGGNVTGLTSLPIGELALLQFGLLRTVVPGLARVGVFFHPAYAQQHRMREEERAAGAKLGLQVIDYLVRGLDDVASAFEAMRGKPPGAIWVSESGEDFGMAIPRIALEKRVPTIFNEGASADAGGLLAHGVGFSDEAGRFAAIVDKILRGVNPGTIPFEAPDRSTLVVNLATARALGLKIPGDVLLRANRLIR